MVWQAQPIPSDDSTCLIQFCFLKFNAVTPKNIFKARTNEIQTIPILTITRDTQISHSFS